MNLFMEVGTVVFSGSVAGVMLFYQHTLMRALRSLSDSMFVQSFRAIDSAITNPVFLCSFFGGLVLSVSATLSSAENNILWGVASALYAAGVLVTLTVHVPRNNAIKASPQALSSAQASDYRQKFNERYWSRWHVVRTVVMVGAFVMHVVALAV